MDLLQMTEEDLIERFDFSSERGFLPKTDPVTSFSLSCQRGNKEYLLEWSDVARKLPDYIAQKVGREKIISLPELCITDIAPEEYEYAMMLCSFFGNTCVFGGKEIVPTIPRNVAMFWCALAEVLKRPFSLSYASYCMNNWFRFDQNRPIAMGNLALVQKFGGGVDESGFILPHTDIEAKAGALGIAFWNALKGAYERKPVVVNRWLMTANQAFVPILVTLQSLPNWCDPYIYYTRVRPHIHGWKDNPALPDGVVYEGCFENKPQKKRGETGAMSSIVPMFDAFLGITHSTKDEFWHYLEEMKDYMPVKHREFLAFLNKHPGVIRGFVRDNPDLRNPYNQNVFNLYLFRTLHRGGLAKPYIVDQNEEAGNSTTVGTGGTPLMKYLKAHADDTLKALLL